MKKKLCVLALAMTMIIGTSLTAAAAPSSQQSLPGQGFLSDAEEEGSGGMIDISISEDSFLWYANESTEISTNKYEIRSAEYQIINNSDRVNLRVSLVSYGQAGALNQLATYEKDIELNLTGDLEENLIGQDLFSNTATDAYKGTYSSLLDHNEIWKFAFGGEYSGQLPSGETVSDYQLVLQYEAVSID